MEAVLGGCEGRLIGEAVLRRLSGVVVHGRLCG